MSQKAVWQVRVGPKRRTQRQLYSCDSTTKKIQKTHQKKQTKDKLETWTFGNEELTTWHNEGTCNKHENAQPMWMT